MTTIHKVVFMLDSNDDAASWLRTARSTKCEPIYRQPGHEVRGYVTRLRRLVAPQRVRGTGRQSRLLVDRRPRNHCHGSGHLVEPDAWLNSVQGRDELDAIGREERSRKLLRIPEVDLHRPLILGVDQQRLRAKTWRALALTWGGLGELSNPRLVELGTETEDEQDFDHAELLRQLASSALKQVKECH